MLTYLIAAADHPELLEDHGVSARLAGRRPYLPATGFMVLNGRHSDRSGERRWHLAGSALDGAYGFAASAYAPNVGLSWAALVIAFAGVKGMLGPFWALSTASLSGTAAAGIAWINSVGNLAGFVASTVVGYVK